MLDDVASELFSVLSQLSDHCVFSRKLIAYKIKKKMLIYISGVSKVVEERKEGKSPESYL